MNIYTVYEFCFHVLLKEMFVAIVRVGGSPGIVLTASQACYALFSECDPHAPAWSSFTSRSPLPAPLSGRNPQLIKTFILFPVLLSRCHAGPLAISLTDVSVCLHPCVRSCASVCVCVCVCVRTWRSPGQSMRAATEARCSSMTLAPPEELHTFLKWPVASPCQGVCRPSPPRGPWQTHFGVWGCFCWSRPQWLDAADVFFVFFFKSMHSLSPSLRCFMFCVRPVSSIGVWVLSRNKSLL